MRKDKCLLGRRMKGGKQGKKVRQYFSDAVRVRRWYDVPAINGQLLQKAETGAS